MKVAVVTWITYNNYGTELQAFALQKYLLSLGMESFIISDQDIVYNARKRYEKRIAEQTNKDNKDNSIVPSHCKRSIIKLLNPWRYFRRASIVTINYTKRKILHRYSERRNQFYINFNSRFDDFKKSKLCIKHFDDINQLNDYVDAFICGSDQIWSLLEYNFESFYYLDFAKKKKISYASSIGANDIDEKMHTILKDLLNDFNSISVREKKTAEQLSSIIGKSVEWVVDPTLLYDCTFWQNEIQNINIKEVEKKNSGYLLCYFLENKKWYFKYAKKMSRFLGLKIVLIPSLPDFMNKMYSIKSLIGPLEFVKLVSQASYVLTDSYHGILFSLSFNKQFVCLKRFLDTDFNNQNIRIDSILSYLNLSDVSIDEKEFEREDLYFINYNKINPAIETFRHYSRNFLSRSLFYE